MIKSETKKLLEELGRNQYGKALREFLNEKREEINDIRSSKSWEETLGRGFALELIDTLFVFMTEKKEVSRNKNNYE
jgi:hypothetical protein